ncbi:50S ribosomal protein L22 [Phakopsora pachyrhizi]|uniref:50S ribosomal protein L22 n=1 Tax=Phakopsora pachyrhizi TaxID=170000 RepID=A0AAV0BGB7_PHAPC|nr:50S ribosomal protein L22 [Phakopsora pachyrhizi]CAH7686339.1 50S ribosomal protein L22 [Phakopsora pachyrhizi]
MAPKYAAAKLIPKKEDGKEDRKAVARSRSNYLRVHFKNTRETAAVITGLKLAKALAFLGDVTEHKQCVPFRRFSGGVGRTAQAKAHKATQGRWPIKSAKYLIQLLKNAQANAVANELEPEDLVITSINVNQAPKTRRRTYRAHGRINPYQGHPCHVEIILTPVTEEVEKADEIVISKRRASRAPKRITAA